VAHFSHDKKGDITMAKFTVSSMELEYLAGEWGHRRPILPSDFTVACLEDAIEESVGDYEECETVRIPKRFLTGSALERMYYNGGFEYLYLIYGNFSHCEEPHFNPEQWYYIDIDNGVVSFHTGETWKALHPDSEAVPEKVGGITRA
jgi:hypothetical protein